MNKNLEIKIKKVIELINNLLLYSHRYKVEKYICDVNKYFIWKSIKEIVTNLKKITNKNISDKLNLFVEFFKKN